MEEREITKLGKKKGLASYVQRELETDALMRLTKEELIQRYFYRIDRAGYVAFVFGLLIGIVITYALLI